MDSTQARRKNEHLSLAEKFYDTSHQTHPFNQVRLLPNALPESSVTDINTAVELENLHLEWPFYFEAMTGGSEQARKVNTVFARVARDYHLAMATGSASITLKDPHARDSFQVVRDLNPEGLVIANLGANATVNQAKAVIEMLSADALEIHLNVAQEIVMPEGDRNFNWLSNIKRLNHELSVPIIIKEVGQGMTRETIDQLTANGITNINVSGKGGTNFIQIENRRNHELDFSSILDWGLTTPESLLEARATSCSNIIASGGITSPLDVIKAGVLGAQATGVAGFFLHQYYQHGEEGLRKSVNDWQIQIKRFLTLLGCSSFKDLHKLPYVLSPEMENYARQRKLYK